MTYTTERAEKEALKLSTSELQCSHKEAIERYCADWDASGISKSLPFGSKSECCFEVMNLINQRQNNNETIRSHNNDNSQVLKR